MSLNQDVINYLESRAEYGLPDISDLTPVQVRAIDVGPFVPQSIKNDPDIVIANKIINVNSTDLTLRVYTPKNAQQNLPGLIYIHGGGFVVGSLDHYDHFCRDIAKQANCVVASIDYRLAPEFKFPIPAQDCYEAARWTIQNADKLNIDKHDISVCGDSAGGCLAAVVAQMARDKNGPSFKQQILIYPVTDADFNRQSYGDYADNTNLTRTGMIWFWQHYVSDKADLQNPYAAPLQANDFNNLPPCFICTAECDPLHDEGKAYADKLKAANNNVDYICYKGIPHGFIFFNEITSTKTATDDLLKKIAKLIN